MSDLAPAAHPRWVRLEGGTFLMGSDDFYDDEAPARTAQVQAFALGMAPVTNRQFAAFVDATNYLTVAEQPVTTPSPSLSETRLAPGSLVFTPTPGPVNLQDASQWWRWVPGASWRWPKGRHVGLEATDLADHPVVHIAFADALAYAEWVGGRLPTETELEYAACAGARPSPYAWGTSRDLDGQVMANTWRGNFPYLNRGARGWIGTSPVGTFPANDFGLVDCIGNVWEWTSSAYDASPDQSGCGCTPTAAPDRSSSVSRPIRRVLKGGSHLCAPEYCLRYRPAARSPLDEDSSTSHVGFRVVTDL